MQLKPKMAMIQPSFTKAGFKSEETGEFFVAKINIVNHYPEQII